MSDGEVKIDSVKEVNFCGNVKANQDNGKRSFLITVDDDGKIEVRPKEQIQKDNRNCQQSKCDLQTKKASRIGKQRIRIALIEEDAGSSEEDHEEEENNCNMMGIDAQSFDAMQDRFIKVYNKNLGGKPSFVVLEDALLRKRIENTLQDHYSSSTCHCHAQQQTSSCDIGAHTGSQTDEFLLQYALRSQMKGHSRGCQATDVNMERPHSSNIFSSSKRNLYVPAMRRLNQLHLNNPSEAPATTKCAPHVSISFVSPQQSATNHSNANSCTSNCTCSNCNNCCLQLPKNYYSLPPTDSLVNPQQQQHFQQQHSGVSSAYGNTCHSSCCLLRPSLAQTTLGCGMPSHCCQHMLLMPEQQCQAYQSPNHCHCPMSTCNMAACGLPYCANCSMQQQHHQLQQQQLQQQQLQQQQLQQQHQQLQQQQLQQQHIYQAHSNSLDSNYLDSHPENSTILESLSKIERPKKIQIKEMPEQSLKQDNSVSQLTVERMPEISMPVTTITNDNHEKKVRPKTASSKMYMARFGRTCLILKPNVCPMPPRLITKSISHKTTE